MVVVVVVVDTVFGVRGLCLQSYCNQCPVEEVTPYACPIFVPPPRPCTTNRSSMLMSSAPRCPHHRTK